MDTGFGERGGAVVNGIHCPRCGRYQRPGAVNCAECGYPLFRPRWIAFPPQPYRRTGAPPVAPYRGAPSYHGRPPEWGFPPVIWHREPPAERPSVRVPAAGLLLATALAAVAFLACLVAAGAELFRYILIVRGRTEVLPTDAVKLSDGLVTASSLVALLAAGAAVIALIPLLGQLTTFAAHRAGAAEPRSSSSRLARLLIPGFNLYGAGQVLAEIDVLLRRRRPNDLSLRPGRLIMVWWWAWVVNGAVAVALLWRVRGSGLQAVADSVELHVVLDAAGAAVAALTVAVLVRFRRSVLPSAPALAGWQVLPPVTARPVVASSQVPAVSDAAAAPDAPDAADAATSSDVAADADAAEAPDVAADADAPVPVSLVKR
ncbi:DUF4328 domain-containing protein [Nakamurella silvestris]|nr:DUF4328 domain-containing protein [Nakamurella silvestris]